LKLLRKSLPSFTGLARRGVAPEKEENMCGIAGVICSEPLDEGEIATLAKMTETLVHRGPDSGGLFRSGSVAISMRRLAIVDIAGGRQPLSSEDKSITLVCNGEIYNHKALRAELQAAGHVFSSASDSETLIHAYEDEPERFLHRAKGMFAFALWDARRKKLILGRDRLGEKPLYLWRDTRPNGVPRLWFASELRSILKVVPRERRQIDPIAVNEFLIFQYVLDPRTLIAGLTMLPAAHMLELSARSLDIAPRPYWSLTDLAPEMPIDPASLVGERFEEACRRMGSADVPVGVALSGGIDSSLVAAVAAKTYPGSMHCFSVGYTGRPPTDERGVAQRFAAANDLQFTDVEIDPIEIVEGFPELVQAMDTPIADIAAHGYYAVSRAAREARVPVLLSGLGGDEVFWGYDWVRAAVNSPTAAPVTQFWKRLLGQATPVVKENEVSIFCGHAELTRADFQTRQLQRTPVAAGHWLAATRTPAGPSRDVCVSSALNDSWLISNCLELADRLSMAWSIEMRLPFLDIDLVEGVTAMRQAGLGDHAWPHKGLLLQAYGHLLPDEIKHRPKQGFTPPVQDWLRALDARWGDRTVRDSASAIHGALDGAELTKLWPSLPLTMRHKLMVLDTWIRAVFDDEVAVVGTRRRAVC
jgi:asparagine synthase (glutamine-hydrolysing)